LNGLLVIELKTLEEDGSARMGNLVEEFEARDDWPIFFGKAPLHAMLKNTSDPEGLERRAFERIGRAIIRHLQKANRQLEAHRERHPRRNMVRLMVLVNEDHVTYDPQAVAYMLSRALRRMEGDRAYYEHVDAVIYLSERHAQVIDRNIVFPVVLIEGRGCACDPWKRNIVQFVADRWGSQFQQVYEQSRQKAVFSPIDHIPKTAPRHERWRTDYRRHPYMTKLTDEALRDRFDELSVGWTLGFIKSSPVKLRPEAMAANMQCFTHLMEEMNNRGIPMTRFAHDPARAAAAARRLKLPEPVVQWIEREEFRGRTPPAA
jgi:hypothetical protein